MSGDYLQLQNFVLPLIAVITVLYFLFFRKSRIDKLLENIPGPTQIPIFGNTLYFLGPVEKTLEKVLALCKHGRRFHLKIGGYNFVFMWDEKDLEKLLSSKQHIEKGSDYDYIKPWLGMGLLTATGDKWSVKRKMLTPSFHFKILDQFMDVINDQSLKFVKILKSTFKKGEVFDISPYVKRCTLDIICETAMGKQVNAQDAQDTPYLKAIHKICELVQMRSINPFYASDFLWSLTHAKEEARVLAIAHGFTDEVIRERKLIRAKEKQQNTTANSNNHDADMGVKKKLAFLDLLLEAQENPENSLTDADIRQETDTIMFGGHDTTATNLGFSLFLFGSHPEIQAKVQEELDEIFGDDRERPVTTQDFSRMKYLENCLKESLRLYPSAPIITRLLRTDLELSAGVVLPAGTSVAPIIFQVHRDARHFPNPEEFNPDRWNQDSPARHPYAYIPFSAGPRNCIGQKFAMMEEKVIMANILRNFKITAAEKKEDLYLKNEITLCSKSGIKVSIGAR